MMTYFFLVFFILLIAYLFLLPLVKKQPIFLREISGSILTLSLLGLIATLTHPLIYVIAILLSLSLLTAKIWIISGISREKVEDALERALIATKTKYKKLDNHYYTDINLKVKVLNIANKICLVAFKSTIISKKSALAKEVFRKFVQNY